MKSVFLVYKTDDWHSKTNGLLIGVGTKLSYAVELCNEYSLLSRKKSLEDGPIEQLYKQKQTSGYLGAGEFMIEEQPLDQLI